MILDRSLTYQTSNYFAHNSDDRLIILEQLVDGGYFQNNRQIIVPSCGCWPSIPRLFQKILSMTNLEKLLYLELRLAEDLPQLFRSCPKLIELRLKLVESPKLEMNEKLKNELQPGFQRLRFFELEWGEHSWPGIPEILT
jgi:hypothetical protein